MPLQHEVFDVLAGERQYQEDQKQSDGTWRTGHVVEQTPNEFMEYMAIYMGQAWSAGFHDDPEAQLAAIRKVTALGVACLEKFGAPRREGY